MAIISNIDEQVRSALNQKNLNFNASMAETFALVNGEYVPTGVFTPIREDRTGESAIITGHTFTDRFVPIQNADAFSVIGQMADLADIEFKNVGSWGNGAGVYAQISLGNSMDIGASHDKVGRYLSLVNSHDGSRALSVLITPFRFFCQNQISKAIREAGHMGNIISIRHDSKGEDRIHELAATLDTANRIFDATETEYKVLADTTVNMDQVREAMARMMPWNPENENRGQIMWQNRVTKLINRFNNADDGKVERMTAWNLYNAIQGTFQHDSKKTPMYDKSVLIGSIAQKSNQAYRIVSDIALGFDTRKTEHEQFDRIFAQVA